MHKNCVFTLFWWWGFKESSSEVKDTSATAKKTSGIRKLDKDQNSGNMRSDKIQLNLITPAVLSF